MSRAAVAAGPRGELRAFLTLTRAVHAERGDAGILAAIGELP